MTDISIAHAMASDFSVAGLPDFSLSKHTKMRKIYQMPQTIPNGHKLYQMAVKYSKSS
jgi:phospholipid N-methyltransferase